METGQVLPKQADPETSLQVDTMILDYLMFNAVQALLAERKAEKNGETLPVHARSDLPLTMVDAFLPMFKANHSPDAVDEKLRLRLRMLRFTALFSRRCTLGKVAPPIDQLQSLRSTNRARAMRWWEDFELPQINRLAYSHLKDDDLNVQEARNEIVHGLSLPPEPKPFYGTAECPALLDLLPDFLATSAAHNEYQDGNVTDRFLTLIGSFMLQAVTEQYSVYGASGHRPLLEAFAWGWRESATSDWIDEDLVNEMFRDEDLEQEVDGWAELRSQYFFMLEPREGENIRDRSLKLMKKYPMAEFEDDILEFLEAMLHSIPAPDLTQLEAGKLDGLSRQETEDLATRVRSHGSR